MKKPIHKLVGYTQPELDKLIFETMLSWADLYSTGSVAKMQILLANRQINKWFLVELKKLTALFRADLEESELHYKTTMKDRRKLFVVTITKIYEIYPKALMTEVKVTENILESKKFSNN